ncbi:MAG: hypothetical protein KBT69_13670 [Oceanihabitans sp.]|nr:hypothetical protein [Oceanihabitans sp.]
MLVLAEVHKNGDRLQNYNEDNSSELSITTTYIIDTKGILQYAFSDADYSKIASISDLLEKIKTPLYLHKEVFH